MAQASTFRAFGAAKLSLHTGSKATESHSTCELRFGSARHTGAVECRAPVATAPGPVTTRELHRLLLQVFGEKESREITTQIVNIRLAIGCHNDLRSPNQARTISGHQLFNHLPAPADRIQAIYSDRKVVGPSHEKLMSIAGPADYFFPCRQAAERKRRASVQRVKQSLIAGICGNDKPTIRRNLGSHHAFGCHGAGFRSVTNLLYIATHATARLSAGK